MRRVLPLVLLVVIGVAYFAYQRYLAHRPFEWAGTIETRAVTVGSRTGGRIKQVLVREGDRVQAGQPLIVLEPGDLEAQRTIAESLLEQAQANLDKLEHGARPEEIAQANARAAAASAGLKETRRGPRPEEIAAAEARLAQTKAVVDKAKLDADRTRGLVEKAVVPATEGEAADTQLKTAQAQYDAQARVVDELHAGARAEEKQQAAAKVAEAKAAAELVQAGPRVEDLRAAKAQVDAAKGKVDQLDVMLSELTIRAPATAIVESLDLRPGDIVPPNGPAATLLEDNELYVRIYVPETQLGHIRAGDHVPVRVDSFDRSFKAIVEHINARGEYSPRNLQTADERANQVFAVRVNLLEGKDKLHAGMAATVAVPRD